MADTVERFILTAEDRTKFAIASAQANLQRLGSVANTVRGALGLLGGALIVRQATRFAADSLKMAESIADVGVKADVTGEMLQVLRFAAEQNGSSAEKLDKALIKLNVNLGQAGSAAQGLTQSGGPAAEALDRLGISTLDVGGNIRSTSDLFPELIAKLSEIESPAERASLAAQIFGQRIGPELSVLIDGGVASLAEMEAKARSMGLVLDESLVQAGARAAASFDAIGSAIKANLQAGLLTGFLGEFRSLDELVTDPAFIAGVRNAGETLGEFMRVVIENGPAVVGHLENVRAVLLQISAVKLGAELGSLIGGKRGALAGAGIGAVAAAVAEITLRLKDQEKQVERGADAQRAAADKTMAAAIEQTRAQARAALGTTERVESEDSALTRLRGVHDDYTESLRAALSEQKTLHDQATKDLEAALTAQQDIQKEFADARAELLRGPKADDKGATFLDAAGLGFEASKALRVGDAERAIELARQAKDVLLELNRQGDGGLASVGLLDKISKTAEAAAAAQAAQAQTQVAQAEANAQEILAQFAALKKIEVGFDNAAALASATTLRAAIEAQLAAKPVVIPVVFSQDPNAGAVDKLIPPVPARAFGGYIPGRSPHARADNILARLTAGEYVLPVPAVRRITQEHGAWVLEALRRGSVPGYALGGLVDPMPSPRVDLSGATGAASSRPQAVVNLTLDGRTYRLGADLDTAGALANDIRREALKGGRR